MFKSRSGSQGNPTTHPPQSIEAVRRRARHRLIGASVLVLIGVLGFPLLFDTQPRPISVDIPIDIPAKNTTPGLNVPAKPAPSSALPAESAMAAAPATQVPSAQSLDAREEVLKPEPSASKPASPSVAPQAKPEVASAPAGVAKPATPPTEAVRAQALLDGKPVASPPAGVERIVVQVGAFADAARAREVRLKVEATGLKTYTHVAETSEGRRIRVRLGPFNSRAEADKAAARVKALGLPAAVLTL
jgi:DedD protein